MPTCTHSLPLGCVSSNKRFELDGAAASMEVAHRVFFLKESHAKAAGYRPCAVCLPQKYRAWKRRKKRSARMPGAK